MTYKDIGTKELPSSWRILKLGDVADILSGFAFKSRDFVDEGVPVIKIKNIIPPYVSVEDSVYVSNDLYEKSKKYQLKYNDILISMTGSNYNQLSSAVGKVGRVRVKNTKMLLNQRVGKIIADESLCDRDYLYYNISTMETRYRLAVSAGGSANQANINPKQIKSLLLPIPPLTEQKSIAGFLSSLDQKIETNNQINKKLEEMAVAIFKHWFVDFEFPNENGEPYRSSGGEMVESELGIIPKYWAVRELGDIVEIHDSRRIPLSKNEREKRDKIYPYYGAASLMDYVDEYIFDGIYVLMGEDGTVITDDGYPILQYVWGKFWVNNHAHVLKGAKNVSDEFIYILLKNTNIKSIVTGAVQLKINQNNLKNLKIVLPKGNDLIVQYTELIGKNFERIRNNSDEIERLNKIRDLLLPKLMSGEIRIPLEE